MEKYAVSVSQVAENPRPITRSQWKRSRIELTGKPERNYHHDVSQLLMESYSEIGAFRHAYHIEGLPCKTHITSVYSFSFSLIHVTTVGYSSDVSSNRQLEGVSINNNHNAVAATAIS